MKNFPCCNLSGAKTSKTGCFFVYLFQHAGGTWLGAGISIIGYMEWNFILRLCVAGLCGTVIGLDREYRVKDAGFRTHFLVALGSALMMIVSQYGFEDFLSSHDGLRLDPSRIAAQVVSGIGFIGAGTIIIHR